MALDDLTIKDIRDIANRRLDIYNNQEQGKKCPKSTDGIT